MDEEIFDVVDDRDEVVGRRSRGEVHRLGLLHRAVHVLVFNSRGQVFLQQRSLSKDKHPGVWDSSASGHVGSGEDYDATAARELCEEIGLRPGNPPARLFKLAACAETDAEFVWVYQADSEGPFVLNTEELLGGGWFSPRAVTDWIARAPGEFAPAFVYIWKKLGVS
jgi:isopentenyldiphosphate isomerase